MQLARVIAISQPEPTLDKHCFDAQGLGGAEGGGLGGL